jgi:hypothetical protein
MRKHILGLSLLVILAVGSAHAQKKFQFSAGPAVSLPVSDLNLISSWGIGLEISGAYQLSSNFEAFGQFGYHNFFGKDLDLGGIIIKSGSSTHIPLLVGGRYRGGKLIAGAGIGYGWWEDTGAFTYSPQVGIDLGKIDLLAHYTSSTRDGSSLSYLGLKAFYKF